MQAEGVLHSAGEVLRSAEGELHSAEGVLHQTVFRKLCMAIRTCFHIFFSFINSSRRLNFRQNILFCFNN